MNRFQFVADHQHAFEVKRLCQAVEVSRSSFYAWCAAAPARAERVVADAELAERIRTVQDPKTGGDPAYGAPRVTAELNDGVPAEERVNHKRVARVMRHHGLAGIRLRRRVRTTLPEPADQKYPDLLRRDFTAERPNTIYVGDITYLPLPEGRNLYLATVIDCFSRKLAGWAIADHMRTELVEDALKAARRDRGSLAGAVFHSDHGSVGGFHWSSQHLVLGGVQGWQRRTGAGRPVMLRSRCVGSGARTGRCVRRCVPRGDRIRRGWCNASSGARSPRASRQRKRR